MARTVIDELVVLLGLDTKEFRKGEREVGEGFRKTRDAAGSFAKDVEASGKRAANYLGSIKTEIMGLLLVLAGGKGLKALAGDMINNAASIGVLSDVTGVATEKIAGWQGALMGAGGTAQEARGIIKNLSMVLGDMKLGLRPANVGILQSFGINQDTAKDPTDMILRIADAAKQMDRLTFTDLATRFGFSDEAIALLMQGRKALEAQIREEERLWNLHKEDTKAAREFNKTLNDLSLTLEGKLYPSLTPVLQGFADWAGKAGNAKDASNLMVGSLIVLAFAAAAAAGPLGVVAAAIAAITIEIARNKKAQENWHAMWNDPWFSTKRTGKPGKSLWQGLKDIFSTPLLSFGHSKAETPAASPPPPGGATSSVLTPRTIPRHRGGAVALEGNNPGGLNDGAFAKSQPGYIGANGRYAAFDTLEHGEQAQEALLNSYVRRGYNTPAKIAARWAPAGDGNNPAAYAANIARKMGIGVNDQLSAADIKRFARAQGTAENGAYQPSGGAQSAAAMARTMAALPGIAQRGGTVNSNNRTAVTFTGDIVIQGADKKSPEQIAREFREQVAKRLMPIQADGAFN